MLLRKLLNSIWPVVWYKGHYSYFLAVGARAGRKTKNWRVGSVRYPNTERELALVTNQCDCRGTKRQKYHLPIDAFCRTVWEAASTNLEEKNSWVRYCWIPTRQVRSWGCTHVGRTLARRRWFKDFSYTFRKREERERRSRPWFGWEEMAAGKSTLLDTCWRTKTV